MHVVAPALSPVFVIEPAAHEMQSAAFVDPLPAAYRPATQSVHEAAVDAVEYLPATHAVHVVAPLAGPVFVIDPASQPTQDSTFDSLENLPASHAVQFRAPAAIPASVIDPAAHSGQYDLPLSD